MSPRNCSDGNPCTEDTCYDNYLVDDGTTVYEGCPIKEERNKTVYTAPDICTTVACIDGVGLVSAPVTCYPTDKCSCVVDPDPEKAGCQCTEEKAPSKALKTEEAAGIAAGIIALIIIIIVVIILCSILGAKKGYDYYRSLHDRQINAISDNPLYQAQNAQEMNPMYISKSEGEKLSD